MRERTHRALERAAEPAGERTSRARPLARRRRAGRAVGRVAVGLVAVGLVAVGLVAVGLATLAGPASAQTAGASARMTVLADSVDLGAPFEVAVAVDHAPGRSVIFPASPAALPEAEAGRAFGDAEVLRVRRLPPSVRGRVQTDSAVVTVAVFAVDSARVGPVPIRLAAGADTTRLDSPSARVPVRSVLGGEPEPEPAPLGPPATFPSPTPVLVALGLLALGLAAAFVWLLLRLLRRPAPAAPRALPYPEALARLDALASAPPATPADVEAHFDAVRDVLRTYVARRLGLPARELTTRELADRLDADARVPEAGRKAVRGVLRVSDLVAFAALRPAAEVAADARARAREALDTIEASLRQLDAAPDPEPAPAHPADT